MNKLYSIAGFDSGSPMRCTMRHLGSVEPHFHDYFELDMVLSGSCRLAVGEQVYTLGADDVVSIDGRTVHSVTAVDSTIITVQFEQSFFERMLPEPKHPDFKCNSAVQGDNAAFAELRRLIARLVKNNAERQLGYELRNWSLIYEIMDVMYQNFRIEESELRNRNAHRYAARMSDISRIINESYQENLTLSELADRVHLTAPYLSKFFDKHFGINFLGYLTRVRLNHAVDELVKTNDTIETVSVNSGFPNSNAFVQAFKKEYGVLPSVYRRQLRGKEKNEPLPLVVEQHEYMVGLRKYLVEEKPVERARPAAACRGEISAQGRSRELRHSWREVLAVTSAKAILFSDVQELLRRVQREIGFRYVKFNGILSDDMRVYSENAYGEPIYSFAYVDKVFDFLLSVGLRPFVQLSFMPQALAKSKKEFLGYLVSEPEDLKKWSALVEALIRHLIGRYGVAELRCWRFTVWHQPDTPPSMYGFERTDDFYRFYEASYRAVKRCDAMIPFGSPPTFYLMEEGYENWYIPFLSWCRENGCEPDFLNFHYYDLSREGERHSQKTFGFAAPMMLRETADGLQTFISRVLSRRKTLGAENLPVYVTEWNNTPSQQDLLNDTCFKSCYVVKNILENYDRLDSLAYWSLTDWMGEAPQPKELFFGGLGMFTANGIPKAVYYAFTLLCRLGSTFLGRGDGWFVTRQDDSYRILLYHYRHFSHLYARGERFDMTFTDRYTPFSPAQQLEINLILRDLADGEYMVTETVLNRASGSSFDAWVDMGGVELKEKSELDTLAFRSFPTINKHRLRCENGVLSLSATLEQLEVRLVVVTPYQDV